MSGVLHPVGPESSETYWVRRALVVGVLLVLIIGLLIFLINLGGRPGQAAPATATAVPSTDAPAPTSSTDSPAPTDSASTSPEPSSSTATSSASTSTSQPPSDAASGDPTPTASASDSAATPTPGADDASQAPSTSAEPTADSSQASDEPSGAGAGQQDRERSDDASSSKPRTAVCDPADLRAGLTSASRDVSTGQRVTFRQSVINTSSKPCTIKLNPDSYELKIYSGTDRIWSTNDCAKLVPDVSKRVKPDASVAWKTTWNGNRSQQGESCQSRPETPEPGYYYATAQLEGAKPVQFLLVLS